jgi:hypothetical protein
MPILPSCIAVLAVAVIFYIWRAWWRVKMRNLRERIAYMLWVSVQDPE